MLSKDLQSLASWMTGIITGRTEVTEEGLTAFVRELNASVDKARQLESACVAQAIRLTAAQLGPNIISFPDRERDHAG